MLHFMAWERGVKCLYYCRSLSLQRADNVSDQAVRPAEFSAVAGSPTTRPRCRSLRRRRRGWITRNAWRVSKGLSGLRFVAT